MSAAPMLAGAQRLQKTQPDPFFCPVLKRRPKFMAGVGHKVGSHALDAPRGREVAKKQQDRGASAQLRAVCRKSRDLDLEPPVHGDALRKVSLQRFSSLDDFVQSF